MTHRQIRSYLLADRPRAPEASLPNGPGSALHPQRTIPPRSAYPANPMAPAQEQIWRRSLRDTSDSSLYNEVITIHRAGKLDPSLIERCFAEIVSRHEIWRSAYDIVDGLPVQLVQPSPLAIPIAFHNLTLFPSEAREKEAARIVSEQARMSFDLLHGPFLRAALLKMGNEQFRFSIVAHQSIVDGISAYQILPTELAALYAAYGEGCPSPLPALPIQYADFSLWQRRRLDTGALEDQICYWKRQLSGSLPDLAWPQSSSCSARESYRCEVVPFVVPPALFASLAALARNERATLFMILLAGFATLLEAYTKQHDIIVATHSPSGRKYSETQQLLGYFLNPVVLRLDFSGNPTFRELIAQARGVVAEAISNDDVPLEFLAKQLHLGTDRDPFVKVAISLQPRAAPLGPGWTVTTMDASGTGAPWDFYLAFIERESGLIGRVQYNPQVIERSRVTATLRDLWVLLETASSNVLIRTRDLCPPH